MKPSASYDVVVVGGGVIGLAIGWQAAERGLSVAVVDPLPGRGSTWAAAGMLAPVAEAHFGETDLAILNSAAVQAWPAFAAALESASGQPVHLRTEGTLLVAADASDRASLDRMLAFHLEIGLAATRLSAGACRDAEPLLAPGISGGVELPGDHQVDNRCVAAALERACVGAGVELVPYQAIRIVVEAGRTTGIVLPEGDRVAAGTVVVAAGCRSGGLDGLPDAARPPVRPVRGATVRLRAPAGAPRLQRTVRALVHGRTCYLVPRTDGELVLGATSEERGFDLDIPLGGLSDLLGDARRVVPALDEYSYVETTAGLRPGTPDNGPIVGPTLVAGLVLATGHNRNGILLAPLTADSVAAALSGSPRIWSTGTDPLTGFTLGRFGDADPTPHDPSPTRTGVRP